MNGEKILEKILRHGASEAEVSKKTVCEKTVIFENNRLKSLKVNNSTSYRFRAVVNNQLGVFSTNSQEHLSEAWVQVVAIAKASDFDPDAVLPEPQPLTPISGLFEERAVTLSEVLRVARKLVEVFKNFDRRLSVDSARVEVVSSDYSIINSKGVKAEEKRGFSQYFIMGLATEDEAVSSFDYRMNTGVSWEKTIATVEENAISLASCLIQSLGARPAPIFTGEVLLSPETVSEFLEALEFLVNARNIQEKRSVFAGKIGQTIGSSCFTLEDQPHQPGQPWSTAFDSEGVPTRPLTIIKKGVLTTYLYDTYAARRDMTVSTGHADGHFHSPVIQPTASLKEMRESITRGIVVRRFSGNINPINGMVSGLVKGGWYIENGQLTYPITDTMLSGDFFNLLRNITAISQETEPTFVGPLPYLLIKGVNILGNKK
ncbi:MAG: TldD/PmbA family protein [Candidatus Omnitrophica bacterium]|nr:TldD/PmbA family protein [Candidatus Omnitrophota bacterium]